MYRFVLSTPACMNVGINDFHGNVCAGSYK